MSATSPAKQPGQRNSLPGAHLVQLIHLLGAEPDTCRAETFLQLLDGVRADDGCRDHGLRQQPGEGRLRRGEPTAQGEGRQLIDNSEPALVAVALLNPISA